MVRIVCEHEMMVAEGIIYAHVECMANAVLHLPTLLAAIYFSIHYLIRQ